jgi:hypothetical protein
VVGKGDLFHVDGTNVKFATRMTFWPPKVSDSLIAGACLYDGLSKIRTIPGKSRCDMKTKFPKTRMRFYTIRR